MVDGHLNFDTKINDTGFNKGVKGLGKGLDSIKGRLVSIAGLMATAFSGKEMIEAAAEMKAAESQFEQTFGALKDNAQSAIDAVADESGILKNRLRGTATGIYAFAKTAGMESSQALDMMSDALQVAADSAAYYDRSLEETSETLKSYLKGNYANDAALGISSTEFTRNAKALELYGRKFAELSEAQKQLTLLQMVKDANKLSGAEGQAAREAEGWENVTGNLKQAWRELLAAVGTPVLAGAVSVVKRLTTVLQRLTETAKVTSDAIMSVFGLTDSTAASTASVAEETSAAAENYDDMAAAAEAAQEANDKSLASFDQINKLGGEDAAVSAPDAGTPAADTVEVTADTSAAEKKMSGFEKKLRRVFDKIKGYAGDARKYLGDNFGGVFDKAIADISGEGAQLRTTFGQIFSDLGTLAEPFRSYLENDFTPFLRTRFSVISSIVTGLFDSFNMVFADIWDVAVFPVLQSLVKEGLPLITQFATQADLTLGVLFGGIKDIFDTWWTDYAKPILGELTTVWTDTVSILKKNWDKYGVPIFTAFRTALTKTKDIVIDVWKKWLNPVFDKAMAAADEIWKKHLSPLLDNIIGLVGDLTLQALKVYNKVIAPIVGWVVDKLAPIVEGVLSAIVDNVSSHIRLILDVANGFVTFLRGVFTGDLDTAFEGIKAIFSPIGAFFKEKFEGARDVIKAAFSFIGGWAKDRWSDVKSGFRGVGSWFAEKFGTAYGNIVTQFSGIRSFFADRKADVIGAFKELGGDLKEKFSDAWEKIRSVMSIESVREYFSGIGTAVGTAIQGAFISVINNALELIEDTLNFLPDNINGVLQDITDLTGTELPLFDTVTLPRIPALAQGMAVPANYGEFLAVLGDNKREPEVVSPVSTMEAAMRRVLADFGGTGGGDINMTIELDGDVVYRKLVKRTKEHVDSTGVNEFLY